MIFNPNKVAFGRHESFALRYGWLTKGFQAFSNDPGIFSDDEATVILGVGKNMVNAIRYWLQATQIVKRTAQGLEVNELGQLIFGEDGYDPYLEDEATIWLLHWQLASNPELATAWFWFFNRFHKPEFTGQEVASSLIDFARENVASKFSVTTVKNDALVVLRMYSPSKGIGRTPIEEALDSPLSLLGLVTQNPGGRSYLSAPAERETLPIGIVAYALAQIFNVSGKQQMPIEELMYGKSGMPALGAVFRLTENGLLLKLEKLAQQFPEKFSIR
ncbi:MAG TPA: DUF4007 family protein, partial [Gammaproteobacteria bacterium]|nr:DUF4007 family protein [Gammaproteobacteria bacterium]